MRFFSKFSSFIVFLVLIFFVQVLSAQTGADLRVDIYSKLKCCACKDVFEKCTCKEAIEMKAYIDAFLDSGVSKDDIFYKVAKKYTLEVIIDEKTKQGIEARLIKEAGAHYPKIVTEPAYFNFGKASKKQGRISKNFKISNKGTSVLIIENIRVSCSCVTASLKVNGKKSPDFGVMGDHDSSWQETIAPGKTGDLEVVLDLAHASMSIGKQVRDIFVASNDPAYSQVTIRVEIEVVE